MQPAWHAHCALHDGLRCSWAWTRVMCVPGEVQSNTHISGGSSSSSCTRGSSVLVPHREQRVTPARVVAWPFSTTKVAGLRPPFPSGMPARQTCQGVAKGGHACLPAGRPVAWWPLLWPQSSSTLLLLLLLLGGHRMSRAKKGQEEWQWRWQKQKDVIAASTSVVQHEAERGVWGAPHAGLATPQSNMRSSK